MLHVFFGSQLQKKYRHHEKCSVFATLLGALTYGDELSKLLIGSLKLLGDEFQYDLPI